MRCKYFAMAELNTTSLQDIAYACDLGRSSIVFICLVVLLDYAVLPANYLYMIA